MMKTKLFLIKCTLLILATFTLLKANAQNEYETCIAISTNPVPGVFEYSYDTNSWTFINEIIEIEQEPNAMAFDDNSQILWVAAGNEMYPIDEITGTLLSSPCTLSGINGTTNGNITELDITALTFNPNENLFYAVHSIQFSNNLLFKIDPSTCDVLINAFGENEDYLVLDANISDCSPLEMYNIDGLDYDPITDEYLILHEVEDISSITKINLETGMIYFEYVCFNITNNDGFNIQMDDFSIMSDGNFMLTSDTNPTGEGQSVIFNLIDINLTTLPIDVNDGLGVTYEDFEAVECFTKSLCLNAFANDTIITCEPYTWIDGNTYEESTTSFFVVDGATAEGCDSIYNLNLTINDSPGIITVSSDNSIFTATVGDNYQWLDCGNNYSVIEGETSDEFTALNSGSYAVSVTSNLGCVDTSTCTSINVVGLDEIAFENAFTIFPNPTKGKFTVEFNSTNNEAQVSIVNINGQVIEKQFQQPFKFDIDQNSGIYFIQVETEHGRAIKKLLIE